MRAKARGDPPTLYVLAPSHYCERARWGLDHQGLAYREEAWAVGLHLPLARRLAPKTTLPILGLGASAIQGSGAILDWAGLPVADPEVEARLEARIGRLGRQLVYATTLSRPDCPVKPALFSGVPPWQAVLGSVLWPATRRAMAAAMDARPKKVAAVAREIEGELDWFAGRLAGRRYLVDDRFGRDDITAASLLSPLALPEQIPLYRQMRLPPALDTLLSGWARHPALVWTNETYGRHRGGSSRRG